MNDSAGTKIAELELGRTIEGRYLVAQKQRRTARSGDPYLVLTLQDDTGSIEGRMWSNAEHFDRTINPGDIVTAVGKVVSWKETTQLELRRLLRSGEDAAGAADDFVPTGRRALTELAGEVAFVIDELSDPAWVSLARTVWMGDDAETMLRAPAQTSGAWAWLGGLAEHTLSVVGLVQAACDRHPQVDRELATIGALVHGIGAARMITTDGALELDAAGGLTGELLTTHEMLLEQAPAEARQHAAWPRVIHIVATHRGTPDRCRTPEALLVNAAHTLDMRLGAMRTG